MVIVRLAQRCQAYELPAARDSVGHVSETARPLRVVLGERVRVIRGAAGLRQQDVADALRAFGAHSWTRSRVAELERGDKAVSAEELILIVAALRRATGRSVTLAELLLADDLVALTDSTDLAARDIAPLLMGGDVLDLVQTVYDTSADTMNAVNALRRHGPAVGVDRIRAAERKIPELVLTSGEAEERGARDLGLSSGEFIALSALTWGRSLSAERDARVAAMGGDDMNPRSRAAHRGRVTRELIDEARAANAPADRTTERG